jgi:hypothetical protein
MDEEAMFARKPSNAILHNKKVRETKVSCGHSGLKARSFRATCYKDKTILNFRGCSQCYECLLLNSSLKVFPKP